MDKNKLEAFYTLKKEYMGTKIWPNMNVISNK